MYGTLRNQGCYDAIIALCADRDLRQIDPAVLVALRVGAHQLLGMRVKPHAAVATTVDLTVAMAGRKPAGFVNAILRRIAPRDLESWLAIVAPARAADLPGHLAIRYSHPRWIVLAVATALGEDPAGSLAETEAALAADNERPLVHLAAVPGLSTQAELVLAGAEPARWSPLGGYLPGGDPAAIAPVADGRAWVQDEASQLAVLALARAGALTPPPEPGPTTEALVPSPEAGGIAKHWLDLCAGPGGKARLLAGLAGQQGAVVLAAELHQHRSVLIAAALRDTKVGQVITADGLAPPWLPASFDLVLADVPCSGLGSLRRRPEARWRRTPAEVTDLGATQRGLLASAIDATTPGGTVAYVTCSPLPAETSVVLADVLTTRDHVSVLDAPTILGEVPALRCPEPYSRYAQFWPHRHGTDAIFIALLRVGG